MSVQKQAKCLLLLCVECKSLSYWQKRIPTQAYSAKGELIKKHNHVKLEECYARKSEWFCLANWQFARWQDRKHSSFWYLADLRFTASYVRCNLSEGWNAPCFKPQLRIGKPEAEYNERTCVIVIVVLRSLYGDCGLCKWGWNDLDESLCPAFPDRKNGDTSHLRRIVQRNWTASYLRLIEQKVDILSTYQAQYEVYCRTGVCDVKNWKVKNKLRISLICTPFTGHPVEGVLLCGTHMSIKGNV